MGLVASVCQPSTLAHVVDLAGSKPRQYNMAAVSADGSTGLGLDPAFELVEPFDGVRGAYAAPLARLQTREGEEPAPGVSFASMRLIGIMSRATGIATPPSQVKHCLDCCDAHSSSEMGQ
jgi:hypothetical protein